MKKFLLFLLLATSALAQVSIPASRITGAFTSEQLDTLVPADAFSIDKIDGLQAALDAKLDDSQASAFALTLLDDADAATARTTLALGNVDNTSDAAKPISSAAQAALDAEEAAREALGDLIEPRSNPGRNLSFIFEGDSLPAGSSVGAGEGLVDYLSALPSMAGRGPVTNVATGGETLAQCISQYAAQVYPHRPAATGVDRAYLFLWVGANGWPNYASVAAFMSAWEGYINTAKADGFTVVAISLIDNLNSGYAIGNPFRKAIVAAQRRSAAPSIFIDADGLFPNAGDRRYFLADGTHLNGTPTTGGYALLAQHIDAKLYDDLNDRAALNAEEKYRAPVDRNPVVFTGASGGYFSGALPNIGTQGFTLDIEFTPDENNSASRFLFNISDHATGPDRPYAFYGFISNTAGNRSLVIGLSAATTGEHLRATVPHFVTRYASSAGNLSRRVAVPVRLQIVRGYIASGVGSDLTILINGQVVDYDLTPTGTTPPAFFTGQVNSGYYLVGSRGSSGSDMTGSVSGFTIWNTSLTLSECAALYQQGRQALPWYSRGDYTDVASGSLVRGRTYRVSGGTSITNGSTTYASGSVFNHVGSSNTYTESGSCDVYEVGPLVDLDFSRGTVTPTVLRDRSGNGRHATLESVVLRALPLASDRLTATATLDFGSIAAGASEDLTITVSGAVVGYSATYGLPAAPTAGITWDSFVSAADTVTIRATNITGSAVDPASATYRATVFVP